MLTEESEHNPALVEESFVTVGSVLALLLSATSSTLNPLFDHLDHQHKLTFIQHIIAGRIWNYGYMTE